MPTQSPRRVLPRRPLILAALSALLAAATLAPGAAAVHLSLSLSKGGKVVPPKSGTWVGTYEDHSGSQLVKQNRVFDLEELLGRKIDVDHNYTAWKEPFPGWREKWDIAHGRIPFVSWAKTTSSSANSGRYDALIKQRAHDVKEFGHPLLLEWFGEMDGNRNKHIAGSPSSFIAAWKRIHRIFPEGRRHERLVRLVPQRLGLPHRSSAEVLPRRRVRRLDCQRLQLGPGPQR